MTTRWLAFAASLALVWHVGAVAMTAADVAPLAQDDYADKEAAIQRLVEAGDAPALAVLQALDDDTVVATSSGQILLQSGDRFTDAVTGRQVPESVGSEADPVSLNNRLRGLVSGGLAAAKLASPDLAVRRAAVDALLQSPDPAFKKQIDAARDREKDTTTRERLDTLWAMASLQDPDAALRYEAVRLVAARNDLQMRELLLPLLVRNADGTYAEPDEQVRKAAQAGIDTLDSRQRWGDLAGTAFAGLSLGSVLLLAALGLAITYGLIGVINMAHGEFLMIGAYATFSVQNLFRAYLPAGFDWYPLAAVPVAFAAAALAGFILERLVLRHLYGRPLETLLTTFGISLLLIQATRMLFGAQNVQVTNPGWMSGGFAVLPNLVLPYNRVVILVFSFAVLAIAWSVLNRTRLGLFVRAVTQNRTMAACVGVQTHKVDSYAFAFGAGIAGLGGCALSQIGNVGPDLGQSYIIDSFMVVVLGGVGQLAGTVVGAMGLGILSKLIEPFWGAVLAKIAVLVLIVLFIQKRPQGMFALKGRSAEA
ncbi:urea ABC transporter permease subunit UrtB [Pigmentiphaga litoralis]|uniref:Urea transport system permease protein n=1 Tax=Pigmentiphaga litoralis TaxID=516702 RepID=A0A7Y9IWX5_9BURK|nr:urea ABC transporter permease subunit UrtB [Pigmentiphaga litoralis]NYE21804.1 urea transport system permease protein [Pigmentiphaga litoralis]NYE84581.1 urea transport system permease protein [Pigmentiphaga litoralis]